MPSTFFSTALKWDSDLCKTPCSPKYKYAINTYFVLRLPAVLPAHLFTAAATVVSSVYITYRQVEHGWLEVKPEWKGRRERGKSGMWNRCANVGGQRNG